MKKVKKTFLIAGLLTFSLACSEKAEEEDSKPGSLSSTEAITLSTESALSAIKGYSDDNEALDDQVGDPIDQFSKVTCSRPAALQECREGFKLAEWENCRVPFTGASLTGFVQLEFSSDVCSLAVDEFVNRTYDLKFTNLRGQIEVTSERREDYQGNVIGGGGLYTHLDDDLHQLEVLGQNRTLKNSRGRELVNFSVRTTDPVIIEGNIRSQDRIVRSGQVTVSHNKAKATAVYTMSDLQYSPRCCYPISGQIQVDISGRIERNGTIEFLGCGEAELSHNGTTEKLRLNSCE